MKKSIAFIGALFMGSIAFAQVSKNVNTNKTAARKVLDTDVKDLPQDPEADANTSKIKGYQQKMSTKDGIPLKISGENANKVKGSTTTQKDNGNKSVSDPYFKETSEKKSAVDPYLKVTSEKKSTITQKETFKGSGVQNKEASTDIHLKIGEIKGEKDE